jgi:dethiobiotin synthetase
LRRRGVPVLGIALVGDENTDSEATIAAMGQVKRLGRPARLARLAAASLAAAFAANFQMKDFAA